MMGRCLMTSTPVLPLEASGTICMLCLRVVCCLLLSPSCTSALGNDFACLENVEISVWTGDLFLFMRTASCRNFPTMHVVLRGPMIEQVHLNFNCLHGPANLTAKVNFSTVGGRTVCILLECTLEFAGKCCFWAESAAVLLKTGFRSLIWDATICRPITGLPCFAC